jgi:hypothetical protein
VLLAAATALAAYSGTRPDPATQAQADGCVRDVSALLRKEASTWVYVGDAASPANGPPPAPQWVHGVVETSPPWLAAHPAGVDDPFSHDSFDVVANVEPAAADAFLLGTGNFSPAGEAEQAGRLHVEWEEAAFPQFAWPAAGDRVALRGSWVWDCGHWEDGGERTELHPLRAVWVQRQGVSPRSATGETEADLVISTDETPAGAAADCAHRTKGDRGAFKACLAAEPRRQDVSGVYRFDLDPPPRPSRAAKLRVRVVDAGSTAGAPPARVVPVARGRALVVDVAAQPGKRLVVAKRVFVGWDRGPRPVHVRVTFERVLVRRAMDPGCTAPCTTPETTRPGQVTKPPGEWVLYSSVAGVWQRWPLLRPRDGQTIPLRRTVDVFLGAHQAWRVLVTGRECDNGSVSAGSVTRPPSPCPAGTGEFLAAAGDDVPGTVADAYRSPVAAVGRHSTDASLRYSSCPPVNRAGCYRVSYTVAIVR